jgi:DNA polymerase-3 subunit delta'
MEQVLTKTGQQELLTYPQLLAIAQGSPGEAIAALEQLQAIPENLRQLLTQTPTNARQALEIAKTIDKDLDTQVQLWLVDYLQYSYWQQATNPKQLKILEKARQYLLAYVQPRLVWECTLLSLLETKELKR